MMPRKELPGSAVQPDQAYLTVLLEAPDHKRSVGREMPQRQRVSPAFRVAAYMRTHFNR